jgi:hypothetical protein
VQIVIVLLAAAIMAGLMLLVNKTRLGRAMRATAENPQIAGLMGVNINVIISATFLIGSALAAVAGVMVSANYSIAHYHMGFMLGLKAFHRRRARRHRQPAPARCSAACCSAIIERSAPATSATSPAASSAATTRTSSPSSC